MEGQTDRQTHPTTHVLSLFSERLRDKCEKPN